MLEAHFHNDHLFDVKREGPVGKIPRSAILLLEWTYPRERGMGILTRISAS